MKAKETKAQFIRRHPNVKAPDLVKLARESGIATTVEYVHSVRSAAKKAKPRATRQVRAPTPTPRFTVEDILFAAAAELGIGHAIRLLEAKRAAVERILKPSA